MPESSRAGALKLLSLLQRQRCSAARWRAIGATVFLATLAFVLLVAAHPARADEPDALRTESPYFHVPGGDPALDRLPLKHTKVDVKLLGPIADVTVLQHYRNEGTRPIEARYVFPGSTGAAVGAMTVRIGDRVIAASIREKQAARIEFDAAKKEGRTAALLEQHRPNVFGMNVANILPGDDVRVELRYTELIVPRDGRYEFVFPTVVGPRYNSPQGDARRETWVAHPTLRAGERPNHGFELDVALLTPVPVAEVASPSHRIELQRSGEDHVDVTLGDAGDGGAPANDRDFVLQYRLAGDAVRSGVMLHQGRGGDAPGDENYFLAMVQPPAAVEPAAVLPREYLFVVDISGSMHGFPLDTAKVLMQELLGGLRPIDRFNVLLFAGSSKTLAAESVPASQANVAAALRLLRETAGGGGTEIVPALERIAAMPKRHDVSRTVVLVTDGYVAVERKVFELVRRQLGEANVFAFGIGSSVNRHLIEGIARAGQGEAFVITKPQFAAAQAQRFRRMIDAPVMTRVSARFEGLQADEIEPRALPDLLGQRPLVLYGKWRGDARDAKLVVEGLAAGGPLRLEVPVDGRVTRDGDALRHLWARARIAALSDEEALVGGQPHKAAITALGLKHGLLTDYTSFIAVDRIVRHTSGAAPDQVQQPSPMPQGVSNLAVGAELPSTPEPGAWAAAFVTMGMLVLLLRRRRGERRVQRVA